MNQKPILKISGGTSHLELYDDYLIISPANVQKLSGATHTIPLTAIITVNIEKPFLKVPYLQIITAGMTPKKGDNLKGAAANVVLIQPGNMGKAEKLQQYVAEYHVKSQRPTSTSSSSASGLDDLEKLASFLEKGIITQEEFELKKKEILGL